MSSNSGQKCIVLFSGGMDSTTLLYLAIDDFGKENVLPVSFRYGSKHNEWELAAGQRIIDHLGIQRHIFDVSGVFTGFISNLLKGGKEIPEGHYNVNNMDLTVVPGRNLIFLSIAAGYAESQGYSDIWFGAHRGDYAGYPDCRPEFCTLANRVIYNSSGCRVNVMSPFVLRTKSEIASIGKKLSVPFELTRSCYKDQEKPCGKCGTCIDRNEALVSIGLKEVWDEKNHCSKMIPIQ